MKWTGLSIGLVVALAATTCLAETPELLGGGPTVSGPLLRRGQLFGGQNWWTRYGEPVNAQAVGQLPLKGEVVPAGAIGLHGPDYVYGPGACECPPLCVDQLWDGYLQHPKRCDGYVPWFKGKGCGRHGCRGCMSCTTAANCGCAQPVSCAKPIGCADVAPDCGCGKALFGQRKHVHFHLGHKVKRWTARLDRCDSCTAPASYGCAAPLDFVPPPPLMPEKQSPLSLPIPAAEDAAFLSLPRIK
jgi:hypothetical protein